MDVVAWPDMSPPGPSSPTLSRWQLVVSMPQRPTMRIARPGTVGRVTSGRG